MTQLLSFFNQVFGTNSKNNDSAHSINLHSFINKIKQSLNNLAEAWLEARSEQAKHYNKHSHIE
jgi:hypothetical protein